MWYQHGGCPTHNAVVAYSLFSRGYAGSWIGLGGPRTRLAHSSDLTSFVLWGTLKGVVWQGVPTTLENMQKHIID
jgi:hypothetical protein